ncbi:MAG: metal-dependent hydrolase [Cyclobacteriaceae bacterium]|nr:metal-dependent hydrolase [Cyclobacteriaceae bacterium]
MQLRELSQLVLDSITHIALGACIGEIYAGRSLGKKALAAGAVAQTIPDFDFIASFWLNPANDLLAHRGFTHSILFVALTAYPLALILSRWRWSSGLNISGWAWLITIELCTHLFLDAFNAYGTAWFEPFSHTRISFNSLFVADPLFSIIPITVMVALFLFPEGHKSRVRWSAIAVIICSFYLIYSLINKKIVDKEVETSLEAQDLKYHRYFTTPTPGNVWLWYIVAESDSGYHIGYRSVFDSNESISFQYFERNDDLLEPVADHEDVQHLIRFSQGYYVVSQYENRWVFNDLRFGQMLGWEDPAAPFVFYYFLQHPNDNELLIQRGRFSRWTTESIFSFAERIWGT